MPLSTQGCQPDNDDVCGRTHEHSRGYACLLDDCRLRSTLSLCICLRPACRSEISKEELSAILPVSLSSST
jgi:hypothetical protein